MRPALGRSRRPRIDNVIFTVVSFDFNLYLVIAAVYFVADDARAATRYLSIALIFNAHRIYRFIIHLYNAYHVNYIIM